jgi:AcrR family transcriptional regulator
MRGNKKPKVEASPPYHHGELREALIQAGIDILEELGLEALTLRATARRAGVSHAAPYHHFQDKEALLDAVAARGFRLQLEEMEHAARIATEPINGLQAFGLAYSAFAKAHPSLFRLMFTRERFKPGTHPELVESSTSIYPRIIAGVQERTGCSPQEAESIALVLWSTMHGLAMLWLDNQLSWEGAQPLETLAFEVTELLGRVMPKRNMSE